MRPKMLRVVGILLRKTNNEFIKRQLTNVYDFLLAQEMKARKKRGIVEIQSGISGMYYGDD